jgi:hypothetical protein
MDEQILQLDAAARLTDDDARLTGEATDIGAQHDQRRRPPSPLAESSSSSRQANGKTIEKSLAGSAPAPSFDDDSNGSPAEVDVPPRNEGVYSNTSTHGGDGVDIEHANGISEGAISYDTSTYYAPGMKSKGKAPVRNPERLDTDHEVADHVDAGNVVSLRGSNGHHIHDGERSFDKTLIRDNGSLSQLLQDDLDETLGSAPPPVSKRPNRRKKKVTTSTEAEQPWDLSNSNGEQLPGPSHYPWHGWPQYPNPAHFFQQQYLHVYPGPNSLPLAPNSRPELVDSHTSGRKVKPISKRKNLARSKIGAPHLPSPKTTKSGLLSFEEEAKLRQGSSPPTAVSSRRLTGCDPDLMQAPSLVGDLPLGQAEASKEFPGEGDGFFASSSSRPHSSIGDSRRKEEAHNTLHGPTTQMHEDLSAPKGSGKRRNRNRGSSKELHPQHRRGRGAAPIPVIPPWMQYVHAPSPTAYNVGMPYYMPRHTSFPPAAYSRMPEYVHLEPDVEAAALQASFGIESDFDEGEPHDSTAEGLIMAVSVRCSYATLHSPFSSSPHSSWPERAAQTDDGSVHVRRAIIAQRFKKRDGSHSVELLCESGPSTHAEDGYPIQWL